MKRLIATLIMVMAASPTFSSAAVTPIYTPTPTLVPTPIVYDVNRRAHVGTAAKWVPRANFIVDTGCELVTPPTHGTASCATVNQINRTWVPGSYSPNPGYVGQDSFSYRWNTVYGVTNTAKVTFDITPPCSAGGCYTLKRLGNISGVTRPLNDYGAMAINDAGEVAVTVYVNRLSASFFDSYSAYYRAPTSNQFVAMNSFIAPVVGVSLWSGAVDINNSGKVLISYQNQYATDPNSGYYVIDARSGGVSPPAPLWRHAAMNNAGQVLLSATYPDNYAAVWDPAANQTNDLSLDPTWPTALQRPNALDINDRGQITGIYVRSNIHAWGFRWNPGAGVDDLSFALNLFSLPTTINNAGQITGTALPDNSNEQAFLWDEASGFLGLGTLAPAGFRDPRNGSYYRASAPVGLSDGGIVIGNSTSEFDSSDWRFDESISYNPDMLFYESFHWVSTGGMVPLFRRMDASAAGWIVRPMAVSNNGRILGLGMNAASTLPELVILNPPALFVAGDLAITGVTQQSISWTPSVLYPAGNTVTCRLLTPPANGSATVANKCTGGTYISNPGFIGTDSFTYVANDGLADSKIGTVTVAVREGTTDAICARNYPVTEFTQTGMNGTLSMSLSGNITSHTNKEIKICPGTTLSYQASSTMGPVVCRIKNTRTRENGILRISDLIKCHDKPAGSDKIQFKIKSGIAR